MDVVAPHCANFVVCIGLRSMFGCENFLFVGVDVN